jgi:hypothetical protein
MRFWDCVGAVALSVSCVSGCADERQLVPSVPADASTRADAGVKDAIVEMGDSVLPPDDQIAVNPCNGWPPFCDRPYDSALYLVTHGAAAAKDPPFEVLAQNESVRMQLDHGIRALAFELRGSAAGPVICHRDCARGSLPAERALQEISDFLAVNPREVLTVLLTTDVDEPALAEVFRKVGLDAFAFAREPQTAWPTLGALVTSGRRLIAFTLPVSGGITTSDAGSGGVPWLHSFLEIGAEGRRDFAGAEDFDCSLARGASRPELVLLHHWIATVNDAGASDAASAGSAAVINARSTLSRRIERCAFELGRLPTFIAVEFYDQGDALQLVQDVSRGELDGG